MKSVIEEIVESIDGDKEKRSVEELRVGLCYTAVLLNDGNAGLAYTFYSNKKVHSCCNTIESGSIKGKKAQEIINYSLSDNLIEAAVGLATINALVNQKCKTAIEGDILSVIRTHTTDTVGMIGFFGPLVDPLKGAVKKIYIVEEKSILNCPDVYSAEKATEILPRCDVVILSATTLINKTIDHLLTQAQDARDIIIVGASTSLLPDIFRKRGVTLLSGIQVVDSAKVLQIVSEGGGMRAFKQSIKKVNLLL
jgi:uncharacterized protein (DUF4213/DUF364 family)